jgi:hypothetical protein
VKQAKLLEIIELYDKLLAPYPAKQLASYDVFPATDEEFLAHLHWMLGQMKERVQQGHLKRAFRWLGFVQGVLAARNLRTIAQLRDDSRSA